MEEENNIKEITFAKQTVEELKIEVIDLLDEKLADLQDCIDIVHHLEEQCKK